MLLSLITFAQKVPQTLHRCATDEALQAYFAANPGAQAQYDANQAAFEQALLTRSASRVALINVKIPVVVHVVGVNPNRVTLAQVERQLELMNLDFLGLNPDSTNNNPAWASRRAHTGITFVLAKRDPMGNCTDGITRTVSAVAAFGTGNTIKRTATGGKDGWPITGASAYFNMWVGPIGNGILGYATFPGGNPLDQGVVVDPAYFGEASTACGVDATYGKGRTLTHEVGHFFNLFHTFQGGCAGTGDNISETPAESGPVFGCPSGAIGTNLCAGEPNPPGTMYQNYMDYTDDACMTMFVNQQTDRMEATFSLVDRIALLTSNGATPLGANDAAWYRYTGTSNCAPLSGCATATVTPAGIFKNSGIANITAATITVSVNGTVVQTVNWTGNLAPNATTSLTFSPTVLTVSPSTVTLNITTVNGGADVCTITNTYDQIYTATFAPVVNLPVVNTFETATLTPGWSIIVAVVGAGDATVWTRTTPGGYSASANSMHFDNWTAPTSNVGRQTDIRTPRVNTAVATSPIVVKCDVAYAPFSATFSDTLQILASTDCGLTFTMIYANGGLNLATNGANANGPGANLGTAKFVPTASQWRTISVVLPPAIAAAGNVLFAFRNRSGWGNAMYIDNINIAPLVARDLTVTTVTNPAAVICNNTTVPTVTISNVGLETITSFNVSYAIDGGAPTSLSFNTPIIVGGTANVTLPISPILTAGAHSIVVTVSNPTSASGTGDLNTANDASTKAFNVRRIYPSPILNGFEAPIATNANPYPDYFALSTAPAGTFNPPAFVKTPRGFFSDNSLYIENFDNDRTGSIDAFQMPAVDVTGVDSVYFEFDLSATYFSAGFRDSLILQVSTDCGNSWQYTTYKKSGVTLTTIGGTLGTGYFPTMPTNPAQWRHEVLAMGGAPLLANGNLLFRFLHKGGFGNNIYIDNINIRKVYVRDLNVLNFAAPAQSVCTSSTPASITVKNDGLQTITGFTAAFTVNGGTPVVSTFTGLTLLSGATAVYPLNNIVLPSVGSYTLTGFTYNPITSSGTGDQNVSNDTTRMPIFLTATVAAPLAENFEGTAFPPAGWAIVNPNLDTTWRRSMEYGNGGRSATVSNFNYVANGRIDHLITPVITYPTTVDSVFLSFDVAAVTRVYPGATADRLDTLQVLFTKDCGATFTSIYKKWGEDLQTVNEPNAAVTTPFGPLASDSWRTERINLSAIAGGGPLQFIFRNISNNGNNVYIDNVNLSTITVPTKVKTNGYMVTPTLNNGLFTVRHLTAPTKLLNAEVYNSVGQLMWRMNFGSGNAPAIMNVDITRFAAGIYELRLNYSDKKITERIIKQ